MMQIIPHPEYTPTNHDLMLQLTRRGWKWDDEGEGYLPIDSAAADKPYWPTGIRLERSGYPAPGRLLLVVLMYPNEWEQVRHEIDVNDLHGRGTTFREAVERAVEIATGGAS